MEITPKQKPKSDDTDDTPLESPAVGHRPEESGYYYDDTTGYEVYDPNADDEDD